MIRIAKPAEIRSVGARVMAPLFPDCSQRLPFSLDNWTNVWEAFYASDMGVIIVAEEEGNILGAIGVVFYSDLNTGHKRSTELMYYVLPGCRGRGVGGALLDAYLRESKRRGVSVVTSSKLAGNDSGDELERMYLQNGFREIETVYQKDLWESQVE